MTANDRAIAGEPARWGPDDTGLSVGYVDVLTALVTSGLSLVVLAYGMSAIAQLPIFLLSHLVVVVIPALLWTIRARRNGELTFAVLLTLATFVSGPVGALGCAFLAIALWCRRPSPARLREWYDYIAGVVARSRLTRIYDELVSGRLPSDPAAKVPRFGLILQGASIEDQQRVLGVISRRYHADFRFTLSSAMRNRNGFIRTQAAAV